MAQIIAFPASRRLPAGPRVAPGTAAGSSARVYRLSRTPAADPGAIPADGAPLGELVRRMRADAEVLRRSAEDLGAAVQALVDADLPGQARAIAAAAADTECERAAIRPAG